MFCLVDMGYYEHYVYTRPLVRQGGLRPASGPGQAASAMRGCSLHCSAQQLPHNRAKLLLRGLSPDMFVTTRRLPYTNILLVNYLVNTLL